MQDTEHKKFLHEDTKVTEDFSYSYDVETNSYEDASTINLFSRYSDIFDYYTEEQLKKYVTQPMLYHKELMRISERMYNKNGTYGQTVAKMTASPTLDYIAMPNGSTQKAKLSIDKANHIMRHKLNHKLITRDCLHNALVYGEYVAIWRDTKAKRITKNNAYSISDKIEGLAFIDNMMLQPLDLDYVRFEGFANGDYVVSFDMSYFDRFKGNGLVGEIKNYPSNFIRGYTEYKKDSNKRWLLLNQETTFAYKYRASILESHGRMLGLFALLDILFSEEYTDSQRNNMRENSSNIRYMTLPEGEKKGSCSLNKDQQTNQYNAFKKAVNIDDQNKKNKIGRTTTLKLAPGTVIGKLDSDNTFLTNTLTKENNECISTSLGLAISALNGGGQGASYSTLSVNIDLMLAEVFQMLEQIQWQYTKLINNYLELSEEDWIDIVYLKTSTLNQESAFSTAKDLYLSAGGSRTWLYAVGSGDSNTYLRLMEMEKELEYDDRFLPHPTSYTLSNSMDKATVDENSGGAPKKKNSELSDLGVQTRTNGGNKTPKPSTRK
ncbi:hypothetical protein [Congzhengia minquanensis]|mgnify:CR=1 FL=1|uniref:Uncharacterized protein n=1 Tax=Congzhengia minquanensis TaxID=2763657 RepID=A0A926DN04_9FIRM|nr:hypothetical protein [Congzhengia minquanensis]MBC8540836.1 hypothetical protein [Congzhengia minquanensis]